MEDWEEDSEPSSLNPCPSLTGKPAGCWSTTNSSGTERQEGHWGDTGQGISSISVRRRLWVPIETSSILENFRYVGRWRSGTSSWEQSVKSRQRSKLEFENCLPRNQQARERHCSDPQNQAHQHVAPWSGGAGLGHCYEGEADFPDKNLKNVSEKEAAGNCCISYPIFTILADKIALIYIAAKRILLIRVARKAMVTKQKLKKLFAFFPGRCKSTVKHVVNLGEEALGVLHSQSEIQLFIKF